MGAMASQITSLTIVYSTVYSDVVQRKHQSSASLAIVRGIHRWPVNSPQKMVSKAENVSIWRRHHVYHPVCLALYDISHKICPRFSCALSCCGYIISSQWMHVIHLPTFSALFHRHWGNFNTLRPRQNSRHFPDDIFNCIFLNDNVCISIKISLKVISTGPINNIPALVQTMAWRRPGDKPLSEPVMVSLLTHVCVTRPQWVKISQVPVR